MKLTSEKALELLNESRGMTESDKWIEHSICVGNTAGVIAKALNLDEDKAKTLGYIHDIGKRNDVEKQYKSHEIAGYEYISNLGFDEEYAGICIIHSFLNNDINCVAGGIPSKERYKYDFIRDYVNEHNYNTLEKLINLCDLMCTNKRMIVEQRIIELMLRRGCHDNTVYHISETLKLKQYFDDMLGYDLYKLFPNIGCNE